MAIVKIFKIRNSKFFLANCSSLTSKVRYKCVVFSQSGQKVKINWWCYLICSKGAIKKKIFCKNFFWENLRNQGENLEKFKKRPCKAKKPEYWKNERSKKQSSNGKNHSFLYSDTECKDQLEKVKLRLLLHR